MGNKTIYNLGNPINNSDAVNLRFLNLSRSKKSGDTMTGPLVVPKDNYPVKRDLNKVISYESQREIFMSKKEGGRMEQPIDMGGFAIENLPALTANDHAANKSYVDSKIPPAVDTSQFLKLDGTKDMTGNLGMGGNKIKNVGTPSTNSDATNVSYVKNAVNVSETNIITALTDRFHQKIKESHISSSTNKKDVFRYLMEDADQSSSEHDIIVDGIVDFSGSPHEVNKKAYSLKLGKGAQNEYSSRIGFNMVKLPEGEYTWAIEFFPPSMTNVSVDVVSTSLNIKQPATELFPNYSRSIVHLHKWSITPPEFIYIDLKCQGTASSGVQGTGYLIVYGIKGSQNDVDSAVYDTVFAVENGKMVMRTDLDMNRYKINSPFFMTGFYDIGKHKSSVYFNGGIPFQIIPFDCHLTGISSYIIAPLLADRRFALKIKNSEDIGETTNINVTENNHKEDVVSFVIFRLNSQDGPAFSQACFSFVFSQ